MNLPAIGTTIHFLSTTCHPRAEAMSPPGYLALMAIHVPHSTAQTQVLLSSPQTTQPKDWDPPSLHTVPRAFPLPSKDLVHLVDQEPPNYSRSAHNILQKALDPFPQLENALRAYNPFNRHTCIFLNITHSQTMVSFKNNMIGAISSTQLLPCFPKFASKNCLPFAYEFPLFSLACLTLTLPKDECTSDPCSQ
jgi:hypothetical protein